MLSFVLKKGQGKKKGTKEEEGTFKNGFQQLNPSWNEESYYFIGILYTLGIFCYDVHSNNGSLPCKICL